MAVSFELNAELRNETGRLPMRRMRRTTDNIPAVIYGAGKPAQNIALDHNKVTRALENEAFYSHILTIHIGGTPEKAILRDIHRHPYKPKILHMDFQRISATQKITMNVPLHFIGEELAPGVKTGGLVSHMESTVEISCLPADLPEFIEVEVSLLELGQMLHLSELKIPKGVELLELSHQNDLPVVSIHLPRVEVEEAPVVEAAPAEGTQAAPAAGGTTAETGKGAKEKPEAGKEKPAKEK